MEGEGDKVLSVHQNGGSFNNFSLCKSILHFLLPSLMEFRALILARVI